MKKAIIALALFAGMTLTYGQTEAELKAEKGSKEQSIKVLKGEVSALKAKIDALPGWRIGAFGTIGGTLSGFNNWYTQRSRDNSSGNIGFTVNAYANLNKEKFFWRNGVNVNLSWVKLDDKNDPNDDSDFRETTDVFNVSSLFGFKLSEKFAVSALAEYRTTILNNFNDPGYLDFGVGATWTPIQDLVVVIHPLNYNYIFSSGNSVFESSLGAKIVADYTRKIGDINFKSNLSMFQSYKSNNLSNITFTNSFGYTLWKMIGVGFDCGLRSNKQEALNFAKIANPGETFDTVDNKLQTFWTLGLTYDF